MHYFDLARMNETKEAPHAKPEKNNISTSTIRACLPITDIAEIRPVTMNSSIPIKDNLCLVFNGSFLSICPNYGTYRRDCLLSYFCNS
mgnify:CR=1 FL=1